MYKELANRINHGQFEEAQKLILEIKQNVSAYDDMLAILEAETCFCLADKRGMFEAIRRGIIYNPTNFELYFMLGNYYADRNRYQTYLCYEQAEFYCNNPQDLSTIQDAKEALIAEGICVPNLAIVICSYNAGEQMRLCMESLKKYALPSYRIIIIDNASTEDGVVDYLKRQDGITLVCNLENRGFPEGCNQGIALAEKDSDILLLNNDTIIFPNSLFWLRMGLYEEKRVGAVGSISNRAGNLQYIEEQFQTIGEYIKYAYQANVPMEKPYENRVRLNGFAMMLKRTALNGVGLLDERFSPGNYEDDDLSFRLLLADYKLLVCKNSFIYHFAGTNFTKDIEAFETVFTTNREKFKEKWGIYLDYYIGIRKDLFSYISDDREKQLNILEVGCGMGATLGRLKDMLPACNVYGIELEEKVATYAKHYIPTIIQGNIETIDLDDYYEEGMFDYILFPDVLEHLYNPETVLEKVKKYLKPTGFILTSLPNLMHHSIILELLCGNFTYQNSGILDRTHLRFYTLKEIYAMFARCGYEVVDTKGISYGAISDVSKDKKEMYEQLLKLPGIAPESNFNAYQYLIKAQLR